MLAEHISKGWCDPLPEMLPIELRQFVSGGCKARGLSTGTALLPPGSELPYHVHDTGEAITILQGQAEVSCSSRKYRLERLDCIYVPTGVPHRVVNPSAEESMLAHTAFASSSPARTLVSGQFDEDGGDSTSSLANAESVRRFQRAESYELAERTKFYDLFAGRFGSIGICGGYGEFAPGASLPCHIHRFDESITIIAGEAICQVAGRHYSLAEYDTAFVPEGRPHRFLNNSNSAMAMIWVYAGTEPERTLVTTGFCDGSITWNESILGGSGRSRPTRRL